MAGAYRGDMDFSDALRAMKAGRRVARSSWIEPGKYVYWVPPTQTTTPDGKVCDLVGYALFFRPHKGPRGTVEPWLPTFDGAAADDWYDVDGEQ
jgi:hypothetical protein